MAEKYAGTSDERIETRLAGWAPLVWGASAVFMVLLWRFNSMLLSASRFTYVAAGEMLLLGVGYGVLVMLFERGLSLLSLGRKWRYRLAFLLPAGLAVFSIWFYWATGLRYSVLVTDLGLPIGALAAAIGGAFLGGLTATSLQENLWENNSPPSKEIEEDVHQLHLRIIGIPAKEPTAKRIFDLSLALFGGLVSLPVWLISAFLVWFEDPGPILFVKNSVGKGGRNFHQFKFRTMVRHAEDYTGPIPAREGDDRVLRIGKLLRKTALDELPQLINILLGEMSFVGPRPQRTVLVQGYLLDLPQYAERHRVLPGLSGLAQVAGDYYLTPLQKLRFDRLYIRHISLGFDLKLLLLAGLITFWYRWRADWNGRLPRGLLRAGAGLQRKP